MVSGLKPLEKIYLDTWSYKLLVDTKQAVVHPRIPSSYWDKDSLGLPVLILYTNKIWIKSKKDGERCYIGKFRLSIGETPYIKEYYSVNVINLDNARQPRAYSSRYWAHPHITQYGKPCWAEQQGWLNEYMKQRDYEAVVELLLVYLESYNRNDPYSPYRLWLPNG